MNTTRSRKHWNETVQKIIAVADIFQALAQQRFYRHTLSLEHILSDLQSRVATGHLDAKVAAKLTEDAELYYRPAVA